MGGEPLDLERAEAARPADRAGRGGAGAAPGGGAGGDWPRLCREQQRGGVRQRAGAARLDGVPGERGGSGALTDAASGAGHHAPVRGG